MEMQRRVDTANTDVPYEDTVKQIRPLRDTTCSHSKIWPRSDTALPTWHVLIGLKAFYVVCPLNMSMYILDPMMSFVASIFFKKEYVCRNNS